jgi:carbon-monoxide dehydrogenase medium subunit
VIETAGPRGERRIPIASFFTGFYETALDPGAIVTGVHVPATPDSAAGGYVKFCPRSAEDRPLIGVAALIDRDPDSGRVRDARIALAGAAPTAIRTGRAESVLRGEALGDDAIASAADAAASEADPLSDLMGTAQYRREMIRVWTRRLLTALRNGVPLASR